MQTNKSQILERFENKLKVNLSLGEGNTTVEDKPFNNLSFLGELANNFPKTILFKREDSNPTGSFKDRSICYELSHKLSSGVYDFAIASSGNAGISSCEYLSKNIEKLKSLNHKITLKVFVSERLHEEKITKLKSYSNMSALEVLSIEINTSEKPTSNCIKYSNESGAFNLRGSDDDNAIIGYLAIGEEIANLDFDSIFTTTSSGTSAIGIYLGYLMTKYPEVFKDINSEEFILSDYISKLILIPNTPLPKLYICQTGKIHPIAKDFDKSFEESTSSLITCVVDRIAKRKEDLIKIIWTTKGSGLVLSDKDINDAMGILSDNEVKLPLNSTCAFSGLIKSVKQGNILKRPLIIVTGN